MKKILSFLLILMLLVGMIPMSVSAGIAHIFRSIDETDVYLRADEAQATVLLFGKVTCPNTRNTLTDIAASDWIGYSDVRVIYVDIDHNTKESVQTFADSIGSHEIIYCYDTGEAAVEALWSYADVYAMDKYGAYTVNLPFTVLLNAENEAEAFTDGSTTARAIIEEILNFADIAYDPMDPILSLDVVGTYNYDYANQVLELVNQVRREAGVAELGMDEELVLSAMQRAAETAVYFSHTRPDGTECFSAVDWRVAAGENIAYGYGSAQAVVEAWCNSPSYYQNIIDTDFTSLGVACFFAGDGTPYWVQVFDGGAARPVSKEGTEDLRCTVEVLKSRLSLKLAFSSDGTYYGEDTEAMYAVPYLESDTGWVHVHPSSVIFSSSDLSVATVDADGRITYRESGETMISVSLKSDALVTAGETLTVEWMEAYLGDVNGDTSINAMDATRVLLATVGKIVLQNEQALAADVNNDGKINAMDATLILLHAVGKRPITA